MEKNVKVDMEAVAESMRTEGSQVEMDKNPRPFSYKPIVGANIEYHEEFQNALGENVATDSEVYKVVSISEPDHVGGGLDHWVAFGENKGINMDGLQVEKLLDGHTLRLNIGENKVAVFKIVNSQRKAEGGAMVEYGDFGEDHLAWRAANYVFDRAYSGATIRELNFYLQSFNPKQMQVDTLLLVKNTLVPKGYVLTDESLALGKVYYQAYAPHKAIKTIERQIRAEAGSKIMETTSIDFYYLKIGNLINDSGTGRFKIHSRRENDLVLREYSEIAESEMDIVISWNDLLEMLSAKKISFPSCVYETEREAMLLKAEIAVVKLQIESVIMQGIVERLSNAFHEKNDEILEMSSELERKNKEIADLHKSHKATLTGMEAMIESGAENTNMATGGKFERAYIGRDVIVTRKGSLEGKHGKILSHDKLDSPNRWFVVEVDGKKDIILHEYDFKFADNSDSSGSTGYKTMDESMFNKTYGQEVLWNLKDVPDAEYYQKKDEIIEEIKKRDNIRIVHAPQFANYESGGAIGESAKVELEKRGAIETGTGGGSTAFELRLDPYGHLLITESGTTDAPTKTSDKVTIGVYDDDDELLYVREMVLSEFIKLHDRELGVNFVENLYDSRIVRSQQSFSRGGQIVDKYRDELEAMTDEKLAEEYSEEFGISEEDAMENIEDERDSLIDELVEKYERVLRSRGEFAAGGKIPSTPAEKKAAIKKFLAKFPDDATSWGKATDEIRDMARVAREYYNEITLDVLEDDPKALQPLNFRSFKKPSEWNTKGKKFIMDTYDKMNDQAKEDFYRRFINWFAPDAEEQYSGGGRVPNLIWYEEGEDLISSGSSNDDGFANKYLIHKQGQTFKLQVNGVYKKKGTIEVCKRAAQSIENKNVKNTFEGGGKIINQYADKTPEQVWEAWDEKQRLHFLNDHNKQLAPAHRMKGLEEFSKRNDLPDGIFKWWLEMHMSEGQYAGGGRIDGKVKSLAKEFSKNIQNALTPDQLKEAISKNKTKEYEDSDATHEYMDSNVAMDAAFTKIMGAEFELQNYKDVALWNEAWNYARQNEYFTSKPNNRASKGTKIANLIKKFAKEKEFYHARLKTPRGVKKCATPEWASTLASSVHDGAQVRMCQGSDEKWYAQSVLVPSNMHPSTARKLAQQIAEKFIS